MDATRGKKDVEVKVIADLPRGKADKDGQPREFVRVSLREYDGNAYLSIRLFWRAQDGEYWPHKTKGTTIRLGEAEDVAAALLEGLRLAEMPRAISGRDVRTSPPSRRPFERAGPAPPADVKPSPAREVQLDALDEFREYRK
jgi:hypothetical protein